MKKLISILLALMLCAFSAIATAESATYSADDVGVKFSTDTTGLKKPDLNASPRGLGDETGSQVTNDNGLYTSVLPSGTRLVLNAKEQAYLVLTQSFFASLDVYMMFKDPDMVDTYIQQMKDDQIEFVIWDSYDAFDAILVHAGKSDSLSAHIRNLSMLNEGEMKSVASALTPRFGETAYQLHEINGMPWIQMGEQLMVTVVNSEYVFVVYYPKDKMTEDDFTDFNTFMGLLTVE